MFYLTDFEKIMSFYNEIENDPPEVRMEKRRQRDLTITSITNEELIKLAKLHWSEFHNVVDKSLITKEVIDNVTVYNSDAYHLFFEGINPECFSKEKALEILVYDREVYGLLTKELQADKDILEVTTRRLENLPKSLFNNKSGINYILDKYNVKGKSWAVYREDFQCLTIKPDINDNTHYIIYQLATFYGTSHLPTSEEFRKRKFRNIHNETMALTFEFKLFPAIGSNITHLK